MAGAFLGCRVWGLPAGVCALPLSERVLCRLCEPVLAARGLREPLAAQKACSAGVGCFPSVSTHASQL